jgi:O-antigen ligase
LNAQGKTLAITAETLYLVNLMLAPGLAFLALLLLYLLKVKDAEPLAVNHLSQTLGVSVIGGVLIVVIIGLILLLGGFDSGYTWMVVILYFTFIHSSLIFMGVFGLVKALNSQHFVYPWIGKPFKP